MNNKDVIIEKIINDAKVLADENISKAQKEVDAIESSTNKQIADYRAKMLPKAETQAKDILNRREMVCKLDCKKLLLSKKTEVVDNVFKSVADTMRKKDKKGYATLIKKMIEKNASDGDEIIICQKDKDIIDSTFVAEISRQIGKGLSLSKTYGDFDGGIMLCGAKFDKNLTFDLEFQLLKEESESELAKILFGE